MSGVDASFLYFETPATHMHVVATIVVDTSTRPGWGADDFVELLEARADLVPMLRRRVLPATLRLHHPVWVDVPDADLASHVTRATCPAPGGLPELASVAASFTERQLDRGRPLWEVLVVEGMADDRAAILFKVHHCATDGVGAARLLMAIFDIDPHGPTDAELADRLAALAHDTKPEPSVLDVAMHTATGMALRPLKSARLLADATRSAVRIIGLHRGDTDTSGGKLPFQAPRTLLNGRITRRRVVAYVDVDMAQIKRIKASAGGTFNDVVIAICGGALRHYLQASGQLPDASLIASVPVSVRSDGDSSANAVSAMFTSLATDVADPRERLSAVRQSSSVGKETHAALGPDLVGKVGDLVPPTVTTALARAYSGLRLADVHPVVHNLVISNVPGPPMTCYVAGARVVGVYPLGPVFEGAGLNITLVSYTDHVGIGLIGCTDRIPDLADLATSFEHAVSELVDAVG